MANGDEISFPGRESAGIIIALGESFYVLMTKG